MTPPSDPVREPDHLLAVTGAASLAVYVDGPSTAATTVVLVHGWSTAARVWDRAVRALLDGGDVPVRVVRYDHRGHGASSLGNETITMELLADDLARVVDHFTQGALLLAGHSMGGIVVMALADKHPAWFGSRVRGVLLAATCAASRPPEDWNPSGVRDSPKPLRRRLADAMSVHGRGTLLIGTVMATRRIPPALVASYWRALTYHDQRRALRHLGHAAVVVLAGDRDRITPLAHALELQSSIPGARLRIGLGAGHSLISKAPHEVSRQLRSLAANTVPLQPAERVPAVQSET